MLGELGYDLGQEQNLQWGMIAWNAATLVHHKALRGAAGTGGQRRAPPGRNAPCPCACGSGRKYETCCLGKRRERSPPHPQIVPHMMGDDSFRAELARLVRLFEEEPALQDVRYPTKAVVRFLVAEAPKAEEPTDEEVDDLAFRFAAATGCRLPGDLADRLLDLAPRLADDLDALRAIALGTILAIMDAQPDMARVNLLVPIIFRLTVSERLGPTLRGLGALHELGHGDLQLDGDALENRDEELPARVARALAQADSGTPDQIVDAVQALLAPVEAAIREGRFPVALPFVTLLPMAVELLVDPALQRPGPGGAEQRFPRMLEPEAVIAP